MIETIKDIASYVTVALVTVGVAVFILVMNSQHAPQPKHTPAQSASVAICSSDYECAQTGLVGYGVSQADVDNAR